ncbi:hypothetical protein BKA70DRAFT_1308364 [Coprinopsis sp. MPI-PUGE-AT-0042]|nr:hypothetical protein BKA70DRAFT_1308364 [Coprinopsis sp. MPI-PUGE-AT-0042]
MSSALEALTLSHVQRGQRLPRPAISTLPPEILLEIFRYLYTSEERVKRSADSDVAVQQCMEMRWMPYSISNVCTYWDAVCALEPEFWSSEDIAIGLLDDADTMNHYPTPASRLERHLRGISRANRLLSIDYVQLKSCPKFYSIKGTEFEDLFEESIEKLETRWTEDKKAQEEGEKQIVREVIRVLAKSGVKPRVLHIATFFSTSMPLLEDLEDISGQPPSIFGGNLEFLELEAYWTPDTPPSKANANSYLPVYPNPCQRFFPTKKLFECLMGLTLSGPAFVSFARRYLSMHLQPQHWVRPIIGGSLHFNVKISTLRPEDGFSDQSNTPFTLLELLEIVRLFCGRVYSLTLEDVRLPLPEGDTLETFDWPRCTGEILSEDGSKAPITVQNDYDDQFTFTCEHWYHLAPLSYVQLNHINGPLIYGIEQLFKPHWTIAREDKEYPDKFNTSFWWSVREEHFDTLDDQGEEEQARLKEEAKARCTMYDPAIIASVTWTRMRKIPYD